MVTLFENFSSTHHINREKFFGHFADRVRLIALSKQAAETTGSAELAGDVNVTLAGDGSIITMSISQTRFIKYSSESVPDGFLVRISASSEEDAGHIFVLLALGWGDAKW